MLVMRLRQDIFKTSIFINTLSLRTVDYTRGDPTKAGFSYMAVEVYFDIYYNRFRFIKISSPNESIPLGTLILHVILYDFDHQTF